MESVEVDSMQSMPVSIPDGAPASRNLKIGITIGATALREMRLEGERSALIELQSLKLWQTNTQVGICYLMYRLIVAILLLAVLACSALDIGRSEPMLEHHYAKWWIYLTHWALIACALQAWLAAIIVTKGLMIDRNEFEWNIHVARESRLHAVYWVVYTIATVYSFIVTIVYWTFVYDPEVHRVDAVNLMVHVLNSVIMLIDLTIVGHPIRLNHAYWTTGIGVAYALFSVIYYLAGGTDR
ncbi:hypothetical protein RP20_CCG026035 [Aedes albopictus]|nr:hypothetical protein RP20_CCG026035 [Aedes albopictus]